MCNLGRKVFNTMRNNMGGKLPKDNPLSRNMVTKPGGLPEDNPLSRSMKSNDFKQGDTLNDLADLMDSDMRREDLLHEYNTGESSNSINNNTNLEELTMTNANFDFNLDNNDSLDNLEEVLDYNGTDTRFDTNLVNELSKEAMNEDFMKQLETLSFATEEDMLNTIYRDKTNSIKAEVKAATDRAHLKAHIAATTEMKRAFADALADIKLQYPG